MNDLYMEDILYNVLDIIKGTTVDGPGFRTSIYFAGCSHKCSGCHNPHSWEPNAGSKMSLEDLIQIVEEEDFDVTLSGGDPLFHPDTIEILINRLKKNRRNVWIYTGYTWEEIVSSPELFSAVKEADVVVDGKFIEDLRNIDLPFRGSENQRLINVYESIKTNSVVLINPQSS